MNLIILALRRFGVICLFQAHHREYRYEINPLEEWETCTRCDKQWTV